MKTYMDAIVKPVAGPGLELRQVSVPEGGPGEHPIVPVMLYDAKTVHEFSRRMLEKGVYVVAFCYPVVPKGKDRIRTQISAGHTKADIDHAVRAFGEVKKEMGL